MGRRMLNVACRMDWSKCYIGYETMRPEPSFNASPDLPGGVASPT